MAKGDGSGLLSIGDISAVTGLSVDVIRIRERRYGFPTPIRLPSGHRRYPDTDLQRLRLIAEALAHGQRPDLVARRVTVICYTNYRRKPLSTESASGPPTNP